MKRLVALLLIAALLCSVMPITALASNFTDVKPGAFYEEAVNWAVDSGVTAGLTATTFGPDQTCTRGQVVTFLWRAVGKPEPSTTSSNFTDVSATGFYYKAMLWAVENNITTGTSATTFSPGSPCTRGQVVTFLWRTFGQPEPTLNNNPFTDVRQNAFYYKAMLWAVENSITTGTSATTFSPNNPCTRGQVVTFLWRAMKQNLTIIEQPENAFCKPGDLVTFSVRVSGGVEPYTYQWQYRTTDRDWTDIPADCAWAWGMNGQVCTVRIQDDDFIGGYQYRCVITDAKGASVISDAARPVEGELAIIEQPEDAVCKPNDMVMFHVRVSGGVEPYTYQWQYRTTNRDWTDIPANCSWAWGMDGQVCTVKIQDDDFIGGYRYRCVITDAVGVKVVSRTAYPMEGELAITQQPKDYYGMVGQWATFSVEAAGGANPLSYRWEYACGDSNSYEPVPADADWAKGVEEDTLTIRMDAARLMEENRFRCVITDALGTEVISDGARLVISDSTLTITAQPKHVTVGPGATAVFQVVASGGVGTLSYQWMFTNGVNEMPVGDTIPGAKAAKLQLPVDPNPAKAAQQANMEYFCVICDQGGHEVTSDRVRFNLADLRITTQPKTAYAAAMETVQYSVAVSGGTPPYSYQWQQVQGGSAVDITSKWSGGTEKYSGYDTANLTVKADSYDFANSRTYRCVVTDAAGIQTVSTAAGIKAPMRITQQPESQDVCGNQTVSFRVKVEGGSGEYTYRWHYTSDAHPGDNAFTVISATYWDATGWDSYTLTLTLNQQEVDEGMQLYCVVEDGSGKSLTTDKAAVTHDLHLTSEHKDCYNSDLSLNAHELIVTACGGSGNYTYRWYKQVDNGDFIFQVKDKTYMRVNAQQGALLTYKCVVTDGVDTQEELFWIQYNSSGG